MRETVLGAARLLDLLFAFRSLHRCRLSVTMKLTVAVGSGNPAKIRSVQQALTQIIDAPSSSPSSLPSVELVLEGFSVPSGVSDQPLGDKETKQGATNRAEAAFLAYKSKHDGTDPCMAVGLEGGLDETASVCMAWMAVYGKRTKEVLAVTMASDCNGVEFAVEDDMTWGISKTGSFLLPPKVTQLIKEKGMELGDADDAVFSRVNGKHGSGTVGILTNNLIDRSKYYEHALVLAMIPWIRPDVYPTGNTRE